MTQEDLDLLAAEYVLGTLDAEARRAVAADLERDDALRDRVARWERRLDKLEDRSDAIAPSSGLWDRIERALDAETAETASTGAERLVTLHADDGPWQPIAEGIAKKLLFQDPAAGVESYLLRMAPGTRIAPHGHAKTEECLMLEGDCTIGAQRLGPGDFQAVPAGVDHPEVTTEAGALIYIRGEIRAA